MKNAQKTIKNKRRNYLKPQIERIVLDNNISMVMQSPPGDPGGMVQPEHFSINPFKLINI
jgi:hypothetical protein